jgi:hypothetical protein
MASSAVTRRKVSAERNKSGKRLHFTPDDIVRTINAVQAAGLKVYGVEITLSGSIKISTATPSVKESASPPTETSTDLRNEVQPSKKRA